MIYKLNCTARNVRVETHGVGFIFFIRISSPPLEEALYWFPGENLILLLLKRLREKWNQNARTPNGTVRVWTKTVSRGNVIWIIFFVPLLNWYVSDRKVFAPERLAFFMFLPLERSALSSGRAKPVSGIYWVVNYFLIKFMKAKFRSKIENKFNLLKDGGCLKGNESNISCCSTSNVTESWNTPWFVEFPSIQNCLLQKENTSL